jgi:ubiquitin-conjugating enzyme E2 O
LASPETLPVGVFVRTWETRLDLIRFLIIGPTETPYANAPFIIDMYLPPAYPAEPPKVYFHSWLPEQTSGTHGRLNPNLYEDGTICLSLLGTWDGAPGESWSPTKSTVLQVIVSILGLVLVREPYYNEAGYEALVGTQAAKIPSTVYSERVYLRSRGLILTALASLRDEEFRDAPGHEGLEDILRWTYYAEGGPKLLDLVIDNVAAILEESNGSQEPNGLTVMSQGACIPLHRVLALLHKYKQAHAIGSHRASEPSRDDMP